MLFLPILFATLALAAPTPLEGAEGPATPHLYLCKDASFTGECTNLHLEASTCQNIEAAYVKQTSSAGPDDGTFCTLYSEFDCRGQALPFTFPGIRNLERYGFSDLTSSVRCDFIAGWASHP
ncbi:hypothetical protein IAQ61_005026 [Plenodomus lingam]|uniref:Beta/gamma crystallin 'Greek key' domain-containing protein n=1 Tax=Leptosphaeria maculans (strain JN3 / isolate v23.1.3 / race Av1-4-5-6-7-8) TaxID=985895 RepID=M1Z7T5_LEPMJ|nr:hypothetical protein IAQ61_005026 [Plenodomus lingam]CCT61156.1 hypothetical protein [Plenodomus lingam JN3]